MKAIHINPLDNIAVALIPLAKEERVSVGDMEVVLLQHVPQGHKFALAFLKKGENVVKYGAPIGYLLEDVAPGQLIDHHNLKTNLKELQEYKYHRRDANPSLSDEGLSFMGYRREDGSVGIRNEIWIIPTVGCVNGTARHLAQMLRQRRNDTAIDAIVAYTHNYGCSQLGDDHENTRRILRDMALHPNAGGVLFVGLGCENNQVSELRRLIGDSRGTRICYLETQKADDEIDEGMRLLDGLCDIAAADNRTSCPLSALRVGLKCGGSDGLSGITANPLLGRLSDYLVSQGAGTLLTEVPEMFGAETLLLNRCMNREVFDKSVEMINGFKKYFIDNHQPIYENPSPGNKAGGISTLEEKSLGCVQKGGTSAVVDVLGYGDRVSRPGLSLLYGPGNDLVAATALAAAGCQLVLFTTGRGTPFGTFVPTVKVSTNTPLFEAKPKWIDFNAGEIVKGASPDGVLQEFIKLVLQIADGRQTRSEENGYRDFAIFKTGVTL